MRPLILKMSMSLDGLIGGPHGELDWIFRSMDAKATAWNVDTLRNADLHVMGRRAFEGMSLHWPFSVEPFAAPMNEIPKMFFSSRPAEVSDRAARALTHTDSLREPADKAPYAALESWTNARASNDLAGDIAALTSQPGKPILAHGGASFLQSLIALGLVDEYRLLVHPVALGSGPRLFPESVRSMDLTLVEAHIFPSGATAQVYHPRGDRRP
jgi:dihydrofolate reductase